MSKSPSLPSHRQNQSRGPHVRPDSHPSAQGQPERSGAATLASIRNVASERCRRVRQCSLGLTNDQPSKYPGEQKKRVRSNCERFFPRGPVAKFRLAEISSDLFNYEFKVDRFGGLGNSDLPQ
jgi:hypothetical protein